MLSLFKPKRAKRDIFHYWDGAAERGIDPMTALRALTSHPTFIPVRHLKELSDPDTKISDEASAICVKAARDVFHVDPWAEGPTQDFGLTEMETMQLLERFMLYIEELKKNANGPQT